MSTTETNRVRIELLRRLGADQVRHNSNEDLLPHLIGTGRLLASWGARAALCDAGMFHSIYGTEYFATETAPASSREEIRAVIGDEAEAVVELWCFGRRTSLAKSLESRAEALIQDRRSGEWRTISRRQFEDLVNLWIADTLEQFDRVPARELPIARALVPYRDLALPRAREALDEVLAKHAPR
jgi:hypothetical protein